MENWFDISIIVLLILSTLVGAIRGLTRECLTLVIWLGGAWLAFNLAPVLGNLVPGISTVLVRNIISGFILFLAIVIVGSYLSLFLAKKIKASNMAVADRGFGAILGICRAGVIAMLAVGWLAGTSFNEYSVWQNSTVAPKVKNYAIKAGHKLPEAWQLKLTEWSQVLHF